jgi:hypothetical protein
MILTREWISTCPGVRYWTAQGVDNLRKYWGLKNMKSIDGLPTSFAPDRMAPPR